MRVLVALDREESIAKSLIHFIDEHKWPEGSAFKLVSAVEQSDVLDVVANLYGLTQQKEVMDHRVKAYEDFINKCQVLVGKRLGADASVETAVVIGSPTRVILQEVSDWRADLLLIGSHGKKGLARIVLGSVSLEILASCPCDVVVVRQKENIE